MNNEKYILSSLDDKFINLWTDKLTGIPDPKKVKVTQRFNEIMTRFENRFQELILAEKLLLSIKDDISKKELNEIQINFVDKKEAFSQHAYASISSFIMYLNHVADKRFRSGLPISSVKKFLSIIKDRYTDLNQEILELEKIREFRNRFVDHVQQHSLHDWMTMATNVTANEENEMVIIYFTYGDKIHSGNFLSNPYSSEFAPPIRCESFFVCPSHRKIKETLIKIIEKIINSL